MNIIIDIGHPAHVHLFRFFAREMLDRDHKILFTVRNKEVAARLLDYYGFEFILTGRSLNGIIRKMVGLIKYDIKLIRIARKFRVDIFISHGSFYAAHAAFFLRKKHIALEDTGNWEQVMLYKPFTSLILTPGIFPQKYGKKQIRHNSYHELAYLNPKRYSPDDVIYRLLNNESRQKYALLRFTSWGASHDIGRQGLSPQQKQEIIELLENKGLLIYISSEQQNIEKYEKYLLQVSPEKIFDVMFFADIVIADSQTMVAEAGILGTPAIRCNQLVGTSHGYHYNELEEEYGLIYNIHSADRNMLISKIEEILETDEIKKNHREKLTRLYQEKDDLTDYLVEMIEGRFSK